MRTSNADQALFDKVPDYDQYQVTLSMSYMEIYKDEVYDLLVNRENVCVGYARTSFDSLILLGPETTSSGE